MDSGGKVTYTVDPSKTLSSNATQLTTAIDDHSIIVNVTAEFSEKTSTNNPYVGGAMMGNKTSHILSPDGNTMSKITETFQEVNPVILNKISNFYNNPGSAMLHEVTESYQGGVIARNMGKLSVGMATNADLDNPISVYNSAHNSATPQTRGYDVRSVDSRGNPAPEFSRSATTSVFLVDPTGVKSNELIYTYP